MFYKRSNAPPGTKIVIQGRKQTSELKDERDRRISSAPRILGNFPMGARRAGGLARPVRTLAAGCGRSGGHAPHESTWRPHAADPGGGNLRHTLVSTGPAAGDKSFEAALQDLARAGLLL